MTQEPPKLINLSVHESSDPSVISPNSDQEASENIKNLDESVHDQENVDGSTSDPFDTESNENLVNKQITIANLGAG